jgi:O-antigen ligase
MSFLTKNLQIFQLICLLLLIIFLPSLEAPKYIFLIFFVFVSIIRQVLDKDLLGWDLWDWIFLIFIGTAFITTLFPGMHSAEWRGLKIFLTSTLVGWLILRSKFSAKALKWLFVLIILSTIPPLIYGYIEYFLLNSKSSLQLHSVGHVNHSAIFLTMIFGTSISYLIINLNALNSFKKSLYSFLSLLFFVSLIFSESRGACGIGIILYIFILFTFCKGNKVKLFFIFPLLFIILISVFFKVGIVQKEIRNQEANIILGDRERVWNISLEAAEWSPVFGIGINNWGKIKPEDIQRSVEKNGKIYNADSYLFQGHSHSIYLMALVEKGIVGLLSLFIFMFGWIFYLFKNFRNISNDSLGSYLWAGSFSAWLATFGIGLVNTTYHHEHGILASILLGMFVSYIKFIKKIRF